MNRDQFHATLAGRDADVLGKILWTLYWRGSAPMRERIEAQLDPDTIYHPVMDETARRPCGAFVHGNQDTTGAVRASELITKGVGWKRVREPVIVIGEPSREDLDASLQTAPRDPTDGSER